MPPATPAVTVVLPFRDAAPTLTRAVASIRAQTMDRFECLLIDNGSSDDSSRIAAESCARDRRFFSWREDGTFVEALNAGVSRAKTPFVARMDADDLAHPRRLERQLAAIEQNPTVSLVSSLVRCFPRATLPGGMRRYEGWVNSLRTPEDFRRHLFVESPFPHPTVLFCRKTFARLGGYRDDGGPEDYDLWLRWILAGEQAVKLPHTLLLWRDGPNRLSRRDPRYAAEQFLATKLRHLPKIAPAERPVQIWGAGPTGRRWGRALLAAGYSIAAFLEVDPGRTGKTWRGINIAHYSSLRREDGFLLVAVGSPAARSRIEKHLAQQGWTPEHDYLAVA